jgi:ActR/RegA family two-component response regulator
MAKVLIAEDELILADLLEATLVNSGYDVCGIARTVAEGVSLARYHRPDFAIINFHLADGDRGTDLAAELEDIPALGILFVTGNVGNALTAANGHACLAKPYRENEVRRALEIVGEMVAGGTSSLPFPAGFKVLPETSPAMRRFS